MRTYFCVSNTYRNITTINYKDIITFCCINYSRLRFNDLTIMVSQVSPTTLDVVLTAVRSMMATSKETKWLTCKLVSRKSVLFQSLKYRFDSHKSRLVITVTMRSLHVRSNYIYLPPSVMTSAMSDLVR